MNSIIDMKLNTNKNTHKWLKDGFIIIDQATYITSTSTILKNSEFIGNLVWFINPMSSINIGILIAYITYHIQLICCAWWQMSQSVVSDVLMVHMHITMTCCYLVWDYNTTNILINMSKSAKLISDSYHEFWLIKNHSASSLPPLIPRLPFLINVHPLHASIHVFSSRTLSLLSIFAFRCRRWLQKFLLMKSWDEICFMIINKANL